MSTNMVTVMQAYGSTNVYGTAVPPDLKGDPKSVVIKVGTVEIYRVAFDRPPDKIEKGVRYWVLTDQPGWLGANVALQPDGRVNASGRPSGKFPALKDLNSKDATIVVNGGAPIPVPFKQYSAWGTAGGESKWWD